MRKNIHLPDDLIEEIREIRFNGRYPTETSAIISLLWMATFDIKQQPGFCYLATAEFKGVAQYKIGYSKDPLTRMTTLSCEVGEECKLLFATTGGKRVETLAHYLFIGYNIKGEWFECNPDILSFFENSPYLVDEDQLDGAKEPPKKVTVKLTLMQHEKLDRAAKKVGLSVHSYLRSKGLEAADAG